MNQNLQTKKQTKVSRRYQQTKDGLLRDREMEKIIKDKILERFFR